MATPMKTCNYERFPHAGSRLNSQSTCPRAGGIDDFAAEPDPGLDGEPISVIGMAIVPAVPARPAVLGSEARRVDLECRIAQIEFRQKSLATRSNNRKTLVENLKRELTTEHRAYVVKKRKLEHEAKLLNGNEATLQMIAANLAQLKASLANQGIIRPID